jgi:hypothetical protein
VTVPDLGRDPVKVSSVVLATQIGSEARGDRARDPLVMSGRELVPNVAHVVTTAQPVYFYYEVYDPAQAKVGVAGEKGHNARVLTNVSLYRSGVKVYDTPLQSATAISAPGRHADVFEVTLPPGALQPGYYLCQVTVIDDVAGTFAFPRLALYVRKQ